MKKIVLNMEYSQLSYLQLVKSQKLLKQQKQ